MKLIVAGIGTSVGKTLVSAILVELLQSDYWKPLQAGDFETTDTMMVKKLVSYSGSVFHPESYLLRAPLSPHHAARLEGIRINKNYIVLPQTDKPLVIEMAGGLLSPLNEKITQFDLYSKWDCQWIIVSRHYLGSINHTLLTIDYMKLKKLDIKGIIFNGKHNPDTEQFICKYTKTSCLGRIDEEEQISPITIKRYASLWKPNF